jgi:ketosteroid isomerase-like protein
MSNIRSRTFPALVSATLLLVAACGAPEPAAGTDADSRAQLARISDAWDAAIVRKDREAIAANMAEDFRQISADGQVRNKEDFLRILTDARLVIDPYSVEDFEIRLHGDIALLSGHTRMKGKYDGAAFVEEYRYIDIYAFRDGQWRIISVQISRIPGQPAN